MTARITRLLLASRNSKKLQELVCIIKPLGIDVVSLLEFPDITETVETGTTFAENAIIKAQAALNATGLPSLADDSGLVVEALGGEPGVYSARFSGPGATDESNNQFLLTKLANVPDNKRNAAFVAVIALALPAGEILIFRGETTGKIIHNPRGVNGFGYDPLFLSDDLGITMAEADIESKNRISHRGRAINKLLEELENLI